MASKQCIGVIVVFSLLMTSCNREKMAQKSVLIVDSQNVVEEFLHALELEKEGCVVGAATTVREALDALEMQKYDVILMELSLESGPGVSRGGFMAGTQILEAVKEKYPATKIIVVTQLNNPDIKREVIELGAFSFIPKPVSVSQVKASIKDALETPASNNK